MPVCSVCGKEFPREMMELKRDNHGKWVALCHACGGANGDVSRDSADNASDDPAPNPGKSSDTAITKIDGHLPKEALAQMVGGKGAVPKAASSDHAIPAKGGQDGPGSARMSNDTRTVRDRLKKKELDDFERMKDALRSLAGRYSQKPDATEEELFQRRAHERIMTNLQLEYAHVRDEVMRVGIVRDISQGGIRFATQHALIQGDILRAVVHSSGEAAGPEMVETYLEVRRILSSSEEETEVGCRFISRATIDEKNRRRYIRHEFEGPIFYSRKGCLLIAKGRALDISQGGIRMLARDPLDLGEELSMRIRTEPPAFAYADLVGFMKVVRFKRLGARQFDIGCSFQKVRVIPISKTEPSVMDSPPAAEE